MRNLIRVQTLMNRIKTIILSYVDKKDLSTPEFETSPAGIRSGITSDTIYQKYLSTVELQWLEY